MIGPNPSLPALAGGFQRWLDDNEERLARFRTLPADFGDKVALLRELQAELYDAGWARYGWSERLGALGGTVRHRAVLVDVLERNGYPPRHVFEHLDILPPAIERFANDDLAAKVFLPTLRGDVLWCQGFSEPTAGSDLASLKTKARRVEGGYRVDGHKIWTSWAKWATHCLFLARTGSVEERHRGISAFIVDIGAPGLEVGVIRQGNGTDEFAEVFFDDCFVPEGQRVGEEGEGWAVAMHILSGERGSYAWLRQTEMLPRLEQLSQLPGAETRRDRIGDVLLRLLRLRCRARAVVDILGRGEAPGPLSSVTKVLAIDSEQFFYDVARELLAPRLDLGIGEDAHDWQEHYLYSRASSVYGGSKQIQFNVISKLLIQQGGDESESDPELAAVRASVAEALEQSGSGREALDGLDWWSFAASPDDAFSRAGFAAWFEAAGRGPTPHPALGGVRGSAVAEALGASPEEIAVGVRAGDGVLAYGLDEGAKWLAVEEGEAHYTVFEAASLERAPSTALDPAVLAQVALSGEGRSLQVDAAADARALDLARIAAATEMLGAARGVLDRAIAHTNDREQFGQPLSRFQAIQHIVAQAWVEVSALDETCRAALEQWSAGDAHDIARVAKALAGYSGRIVAQHSLQCFGAIGFTEEHEFPGYQKRIHTLDMLLGSYYALRDELGAQIVRTGAAPRGVEVWRPDEVA